MSPKFQTVGTFNALHPTCAAMAQVPTPAPWEVSLAESRLLTQRRLRDISGPVPTIRSIERVRASQEERSVPLTLYRPHLEGPLPLFIFIHGGGFVVGEHDEYHALCARIANCANCVVASVGYGLSPETVFPHALKDCQLAYEWLDQEAADLGLISGRTIIGGDSAGGNLAAALALLGTQGVTKSPLGTWQIYPVLDFLAQTPSRDLFAVGYGLDRDVMSWFGQQYLSDGAVEGEQVLASPARMNEASVQTFPPTLIQTAGFDPLKDEAKDFAVRLDAHGRLLAYTCYEEMTHGFINAFDLLAESQMAVDEGVLWLRRLFQG